MRQSSDPALQDDPATTEDIEESWTFIGDEDDPDLKEKIRSWENAGLREGRAPRVSLDRISIATADLRAGDGVGVGVDMGRKGSLTTKR